MRLFTPLVTGHFNLNINNKSTVVQINLAKNIRFQRERKSWSQEDLAHKSGIHVTYLSGIECGRRNPTVKILERLALALDIPVSILFE